MAKNRWGKWMRSRMQLKSKRDIGLSINILLCSKSRLLQLTIQIISCNVKPKKRHPHETKFQFKITAEILNKNWLTIMAYAGNLFDLFTFSQCVKQWSQGWECSPLFLLCRAVKLIGFCSHPQKLFPGNYLVVCYSIIVWDGCLNSKRIFMNLSTGIRFRTVNNF